MRLLLSVLAISCVSAAAFASDGIPARDRLSGLDGVKFGMDFAAVKLELGAGARVDVDPSDPAVRVLLASRTLFGEKFSFNYTFGDRGKLSAIYASASLPTGDQGACQVRWVAVMGGVQEQWGKPDANDNQLSAKVPMQTITYQFDDGSQLEAGLLGCLLTVNYLSPMATP